MPDDVQTIRDLLAARDAAVAAGDAAAAVASMADGAVTYDLPPPLRFVHDRAGAIAGLQQWFATWDGPVRTELSAPAILVSGDLAVAHGLARMRGTKRDEGPQDLWYRSTIALERRADGWRIVHEHNSFPLNMDASGTAATDLKPE